MIASQCEIDPPKAYLVREVAFGAASNAHAPLCSGTDEDAAGTFLRGGDGFGGPGDFASHAPDSAPRASNSAAGSDAPTERRPS